MKAKKYMELDMVANDKTLEQELDLKDNTQIYNSNLRKKYHALQMHYLRIWVICKEKFAALLSTPSSFITSAVC